MKNLKLVIGHLMNDQLSVKSVPTSKSLGWLKQLDPEELVEFFAELLKLVTQISEGKKDAQVLSIFLSEWRETASLNSEPEVLEDILEAETIRRLRGKKKGFYRYRIGSVRFIYRVDRNKRLIRIVQIDNRGDIY